MTTLTKPRTVPSLLWQTLRLYARYFLPLFLVGSLPTLLYTLALLVLGHSAPPKMDLQAAEILSPALRQLFLWNLPSLLLLQPLCSGALVAAVGQLQRQEPLQPVQALCTALKAWKPLLVAAGLFWLPAAGTAGFGYWVWHHTQTSPGQMLGGMLMIALVAGFVCYWWVRWSFVSQVIIEEGLYDKPFVQSQTDLPLLVHREARRFVRGPEITQGEREDQFYWWDASNNAIAEAPRGTLELDGDEPALEGTHTTTGVDGAAIEVTTVWELLRAQLAEYTPELAGPICGVHPDVIRSLARDVASKRTKIVEGAVGMVELALEQLDKSGKVQLDAERRAVLVGNLLVVLCSHENPTPVLNTGSLYN